MVPIRTWQPGRILLGGDYNPEQWPRETWTEDVRLMREAGVSMVSVGIFSWALLEPAPGRYEFGWLDDALDLLHGAGIAVDLATATATPPPWFSRRHLDSLPTTADGTRLWPGGRQAWCPSSPAYRRAATSLAEALAVHYADHPALAMWHVGNESGGHNAHCYCDVSAAAFRVWLRARYGDLDALNHAWGTAFWSQGYTDWDEILPPRTAPTFPNPTQQLDFRRFSSDELLACYVAERDVLHRVTPGVPVTTNFMVMKQVRDMDYWAWAKEVDLVANDHYLEAADPQGHVELAFCADLTRSLAGGKPWLLMEHSTSAVNWQPRNVAKSPGQLRRNSMQHVARGADGTLYFQWRASRAGAEKFHSAMLPHAGTDTAVWREVCAYGADLDSIAAVAGSTVTAEVAMVFDWHAWWAVELDSHPSADVTYLDRLHAHYRALWDRGVTVDFVEPDADLSGYRLVLAPTLYLVDEAGAENLRAYAEGGGTLVITYFSGIVNEHDHIRLGGYPGAFREVLGVRTEEFFPLRSGEQVHLDDGSSADVWTELVHLEGAEAVASYVDGPLPGTPAITRRDVGTGTAWYVATRLDDAAIGALTDRLLTECAVERPGDHTPGVEVVRRRGRPGRQGHSSPSTYLFAINHTEDAATIAGSGRDLLTGAHHERQIPVPAGGVVVVEEVA